MKLKILQEDLASSPTATNLKHLLLSVQLIHAVGENKLNTAANAWTRFWFASSIAISTACLIATLFHIELDASPSIPHLLRSLELTGENSVGAWWSGMLLLLAAVHMTDGFMGNRERPRIALGWLAVASVMLLLSADEVGSVHERAGLRGIPFAMPLAAALGFGLLALWSSGQRRPAVWIAVALVFFASVAGQEYLEDYTKWYGDRGGMRAALEEGCELVAMIILLRVGLGNLRPPHVALEALYVWRGRLLLGVLIAAAPVAFYTAGLSDDRGYPSGWLVGACFLLAGLAVARRGLQFDRAFPGKAHALLALLCAVASVNAVVHNPTYYPNRGYLILTAILLAMGALVPATVRRGRRLQYLGVVVVSVGLVAVCWNGVPLFIAYTVLAAVAGLVMYAHAVIGQRVPATERARANTSAATTAPA